MDSELAGNSLEKLIGYYEHSSAESQISILKESYGLSDFNNVETADRKLIINNKLEFWVHDFVLNSYCDYFTIPNPQSPIPIKKLKSMKKIIILIMYIQNLFLKTQILISNHQKIISKNKTTKLKKIKLIK